MSPLFMNQKVHPIVFTGKSTGNELNKQVVYRTNVVSDIAKQQQNMNRKILESIQQMSTFVHHSKNEEIWKDAIIEQLKIQEKSSYRLTKGIENQENLYQELQQQFEKQEVLYRSLIEKLELQDVFHKTILEQIEKQEAINHKILRQLDNLKAILFERVTHIVDKVEFNYKQVINLFFGLFSKREYSEEPEEATNIIQIDANEETTQTKDDIVREMEKIL